MPHTQIITGNDEACDYLEDHGLTYGYVEPHVALLQREGTSSGQPCVIFIVEVEGKKVVVKTSLPMLEVITSTMRAASGIARPP